MIKKENKVNRMAVLGRNIFSNEKEFHVTMGPSVIACSGLFGFANVVPHECNCKVEFIDTEWNFSGKTIAMLYTEMFCHQTFGYNNVRLLESGRYVQKRVSSKLFQMRDEPFELPDDGIVLITGGNGSLGLRFGEWMLAKTTGSGKQYEIQFVSRSSNITTENIPVWETIANMADKQGVKVSQVCCDVSSQLEVDSLFEKCNGNVAGIIHAAGSLRDALIVLQNRENTDIVLGGKAHGALRIHDALERYQNPKLKFFVMFSSLSAQGNMGQCSYAAACSFLDGLARHRRALGVPGTSVQWGPWGEVGMAASLAEVHRQRIASGPTPYYTNEEAFQGFEAGLKTGLPNFAVNKYNAEVIVQTASLQPAKFQHFISEVIPCPPPAKFGYRDLAYETYVACRNYKEPYADEDDWLNFNELIRPCLDHEERRSTGNKWWLEQNPHPKILHKTGARRSQNV